ncbi:MAG: glycoside hydrolase family 5 protein, partial [Clostridiales bacterium]|nr:glycoside hydrolase family 5 protein [Clostridiales bacterium]
CRDKNGNTQSRVDFTAANVALARSRGITCVWWDNAAFEGEGELFGLLDRRTFRFVYPQILQAIIDHAN